MRKLALIFLSVTTISAKANVIQSFAGISYYNPSQLAQIKETEFILGGTMVHLDMRYTGTILNLNTFNYDYGISYSRTNSLLPYGRIAKRINDKLVFGVDVTQPFQSNIVWGRDSFTKYASTETLMIDTDISPKVAYALTEQLQVGAGLNFNFVSNNEINWALPLNASQSDTLVNKTYGFGMGYDLGATFVVNPFNIFGISYYSRIRQNTSGLSHFGNNTTTNLQVDLSLPATVVFSYVHLFNPQWLLSLQAYESRWAVNQYVNFKNTAAAPPIGPNILATLLYDNSWAYFALLRYQYNEKWAVGIAGFLDEGPESDYFRTINFPCDRQYLLGAMTEYAINKKASLQFIYAHVFSRPNFANTIAPFGTPIPFTTGQAQINADVVDLRLKIVT